MAKIQNNIDSQNVELSYFDQRLKHFQISEQDNMVRITPHDYPPQDMMFFSPDKNGNIVINYFTPDGDVMYYTKGKKVYPFSRTRLAKPDKDRKYTQPQGSSVLPFITKGIIEKYQTKQHIETLFITEGEFKAFVSDIQLGIDVIGIGGIHNYKDHTKELDSYIKAIITDLQVKNIVLLFDADCLNVEYKADKDLSQRLFSFYSAVKNFKELTKTLNVDVYFAHLLSSLQVTAKGIDDLVILPDTDKQQLTKELYLFTTQKNSRKYITCLSLSGSSINSLLKYFHIENVNDFYEAYESELKENTFIFNRHTYQHTGEELKRLRHGDADLYLRVGADYFKKITVVDTREHLETKLEKWKTSEITRDYVQQQGCKDFFEQITKYDAFCNNPDFNHTYKRVYEVVKDNIRSLNYNIFEPLQVQPQKGTFDNILNYLNHLTNYENKGMNGDTKEFTPEIGDKMTILLDWLTILIQKPTQILPIVVLVSKEQGTGKTTFLDLLKIMLRNNMTILNDEQFAMEFNSHYIGKLVVGLDEVKFTSERAKRRLKNLSTGKKVMLQFKGADLKEVDNFMKIVFVGNDENDIIKIDDEDVRFFVLKVPVLPKEDTDFLQKMESEMPAFFSYLFERQIYHPKNTRAWFDYKLLITEKQKEIIKETRPAIVKDVEDFIINYFEEFAAQKLDITTNVLSDIMVKKYQKRYSPRELKDVFKKHFKTEPSEKPNRFEVFNDWHEDVSTKDLKPNVLKHVGRYYTFEREKWTNTKLSDKDADEMPF